MAATTTGPPAAVTGAGRPPGSEPGSCRRRRQQTMVAWLFALPFVLIFGFFMLFPLVSSFVMSFTDFTSRDVRNPLAVGFVGLDQYADLFGNPQFLHSMLNTGYFVVVGIPLTMVVALALAVALNSGINRFRTRVPGRLLHPGGDQHRRRRGGLEVHPAAGRAAEHRAGLGRHRRTGLAQQHRPGRCRR